MMRIGTVPMGVTSSAVRGSVCGPVHQTPVLRWKLVPRLPQSGLRVQSFCRGAVAGRDGHENCPNWRRDQLCGASLVAPETGHGA